MTRWLALASVVFAAVVHLTATRPAGRVWAEARADEARLQRRLSEAAPEVERLERRAALYRRADALLAAHGAESPAAETERRPPALRRAVLGVLEQGRLDDVRLAVAAAGRDGNATLTLSATGSFADVVRTTGLLARAPGLVFDRVTLTPTSDGLGLRVEASWPRRQP